MSRVEKGRFAIIIKSTGEVSDIRRMEGNAQPNVGNPDLYDVVEVGADVAIGMVRDGDVFAFAYNRPVLQAAPASDDQGGIGSQEGVGNPNVAGSNEQVTVDLHGLDDPALKAFIKDRTGAAPKGNPSRETLLRLAAEADQKASG